jgi:hypothetical protein
MFQPLIERVYGIMDRKGLVAFPPPGLSGRQVNVEFISILALAQKQAGIAGISQTIAFAAQVAGLYPASTDKFNFDEMADAWAEMQGIAPNLMRSDEEVAQLREERAKQQQMAQMLALMQQGADAAAKGSVAAKNLQAQGDGGATEKALGPFSGVQR